MSRHDISDRQWNILASLLARPRKDTRGPAAKDDRLMFNGVLWIIKTGAPWRDLPAEFGPWPTVYQRFSQWAKSGVWDVVQQELAADADWDAIMIDASYVKLHQHGSGAEGGQYKQEIGRSRAGLTTKIHAVVDGLGNLIRLKLTGSNTHDIVPACELIEGLQADKVLADKAYDADRFIALAWEQGPEVIVLLLQIGKSSGNTTGT